MRQCFRFSVLGQGLAFFVVEPPTGLGWLMPSPSLTSSQSGSAPLTLIHPWNFRAQWLRRPFDVHSCFACQYETVSTTTVVAIKLQVARGRTLIIQMAITQHTTRMSECRSVSPKVMSLFNAFARPIKLDL
ncbi:hypothetical protein FRB94_001011 [Tulasnella sp. JGI-2019a]|nr:hypothetical protein FRB94_001011 [Tulasnella sp. JGI-2019a]